MCCVGYVDDGCYLYCWMCEQVVFDWVGVDLVIGVCDYVVVVVDEVYEVVGVDCVCIVGEQVVVCEFVVCCVGVVLVFEKYYWVGVVYCDVVFDVGWQWCVVCIDDCDCMIGYCFVDCVGLCIEQCCV